MARLDWTLGLCLLCASLASAQPSAPLGERPLDALAKALVESRASGAFRSRLAPRRSYFKSGLVGPQLVHTSGELRRDGFLLEIASERYFDAPSGEGSSQEIISFGFDPRGRLTRIEISESRGEPATTVAEVRGSELRVLRDAELTVVPWNAKLYPSRLLAFVAPALWDQGLPGVLSGPELRVDRPWVEPKRTAFCALEKEAGQFVVEWDWEGRSKWLPPGRTESANGGKAAGLPATLWLPSEGDLTFVDSKELAALRKTLPALEQEAQARVILECVRRTMRRAKPPFTPGLAGRVEAIRKAAGYELLVNYDPTRTRWIAVMAPTAKSRGRYHYALTQDSWVRSRKPIPLDPTQPLEGDHYEPVTRDSDLR